MKELNTIQQQEKLNKVYAIDELGPGGAHHAYEVRRADTDEILLDVRFQKGPRAEDSSEHGVLGGDLLEIVRDTLKGFQSGPLASKYNEDALYHVEEALKCMNARVEDRIKRNVLGHNKK